MKALNAYRNVSDLPLHRRVKGGIGNLIIALDSKQAEEVKSAPFRTSWSALGKLIRNGHFNNAVAARDHDLVCRFLTDFWSSDASKSFYTDLSHRYETLFLKFHQQIVGETAKACKRAGGQFHQLVELGVGDGKVIAHFSRELRDIGNVHGIDINAEQVAANRRIYADFPNFHFHHADIRSWVPEHVSSGVVVIVNGGVLEYLTRTELKDLFEYVGDCCSPCVISITESIAADHDLGNELDTFPYGLELSLSHNYLAVLREVGFTITFTNDRLTTPEESEIVGRWLQVVAYRGS